MRAGGPARAAGTHVARPSALYTQRAVSASPTSRRDAPAGRGAPARAWDVVGVGANSVDTVYRIPAFPEPDGPRSKLPITARTVRCGGQTATALVVCARWGHRTAYVGVTGTDEDGRLLRARLREEGVDTGHVVAREGGNGAATILLPDTGERIVLWSRPAGLALRPEELPHDVLAQARVVHVDDADEEAALAAAGCASRAGAIVTCDIERVTPRTPALLALVTSPVLAEHVPAVLTGEADPERALRALRSRHAGRLCVTLGARGALLLDGDTLYREAGLPVQTVDTTGAGDVFRGAFIHGLLEGLPPQALLRLANAAAALACTRVGAMDAVPALAEVRALAGDLSPS